MPTKTGFRNADYAGDGERDIRSIMKFEILELGNTDIFDTVIENGLIKDKTLVSHIQDASEYIEENGGPGYYDTSEYTDEDTAVLHLIDDIMDEINRCSGKTIRFGLWLASKQSVIDNYEGTEQNMLEYPTSDIVISDLGDQGSLLGYETFPETV